MSSRKPGVDSLLHEPLHEAPADPAAATPVERQYLEVIGYLAARRQPIIAAQLARRLHVRPPTVTHVLQRLEQKQLIERDAVSGIRLTAAGAQLADEIIRRHRLVERFLSETLQVPWHALHREASLIEPILSPLLAARIEAIYADATTCPHGNPIPGRARLTAQETALPEVPVGAALVIERIDEEAGEESCTLQGLAARGLFPGERVVRLPDASNGVRIQHGARRIVLARRVAGYLYGRVEPARSAAEPAG
jgi:DtxR family transcriptional regulator, Mn-dependent transcriptional regulator